MRFLKEQLLPIRKMVEKFGLKIERVVYPQSYTVSELITNLKLDGFTITQTFQSDLRRFGLTTGLVIVSDGVDGMRISVEKDGCVRICLHNDLQQKKDHPFFKIANEKYAGKSITLDQKKQ